MEQPIFCVALPPEEALAHRMQAYHRKRVAEIMEGRTPFSMPEGAKLVLHLIPDQSFASSTEFSAVALGKAAQHSLPLGSEHSASRYNADGFAITNVGGPSAYIQICRTGAIEAVMGNIVCNLPGPPQSTLLRTLWIAKALMSGIPQYSKILATLGVVPPVWCLLSMIGGKGFRILCGGGLGTMKLTERFWKCLRER